MSRRGDQVQLLQNALVLDVFFLNSSSVDAAPTTKTKASSMTKAGNKASELDVMPLALFQR